MMASGTCFHRQLKTKGKDHSLPKWVKGSLKLQVKLDLFLQFVRLRHSVLSGAGQSPGLSVRRWTSMATKLCKFWLHFSSSSSSLSDFIKTEYQPSIEYCN